MTANDDLPDYMGLEDIGGACERPMEYYAVPRRHRDNFKPEPRSAMHFRDIYRVVSATLARTEEPRLNTPEAVSLICGTAAVESGGEHLYQAARGGGVGPARSIFQVEPATAADNILHYLQNRPATLEAVKRACCADPCVWTIRGESLNGGPLVGTRSDLELLDYVLGTNIAFGVMMCRIKYYRAPGRLPAVDDVDGQATLWKSVYNSAGGAGTIEHYHNAFKRHSAAWLDGDQLVAL